MCWTESPSRRQLLQYDWTYISMEQLFNGYILFNYIQYISRYLWFQDMICWLSRGLILFIGRPLSHSAARNDESVWCRLTEHTTLRFPSVCPYWTDQLFNSWELKINFYICTVTYQTCLSLYFIWFHVSRNKVVALWPPGSRWKLLRPWEWFGAVLVLLGPCWCWEPSGTDSWQFVPLMLDELSVKHEWDSQEYDL